MAAGTVVKTALKGFNLGDVMNVAGGVMDYKDARGQGNSKAMSVAKAVGSFAFYEMLGPWAIPFVAVQTGAQFTSAMWQHTAKEMSKGYGQVGKFGSGQFNMTEAGYTMRQRSLNAIRQNGLNTQSALGNEARTYFRTSV